MRYFSSRVVLHGVPYALGTHAGLCNAYLRKAGKVMYVRRSEETQARARRTARDKSENFKKITISLHIPYLDCRGCNPRKKRGGPGYQGRSHKRNGHNALRIVDITLSVRFLFSSFSFSFFFSFPLRFLTLSSFARKRGKGGKGGKGGKRGENPRKRSGYTEKNEAPHRGRFGRMLGAGY